MLFVSEKRSNRKAENAQLHAFWVQRRFGWLSHAIRVPIQLVGCCHCVAACPPVAFNAQCMCRVCAATTDGLQHELENIGNMRCWLSCSLRAFFCFALLCHFVVWQFIYIALSLNGVICLQIAIECVRVLVQICFGGAHVAYTPWALREVGRWFPLLFGRDRVILLVCLYVFAKKYL